MRRLFITLSILVSISMSAIAQDGLQINEVFEGKVVPKESMKESLVKGDKLVATYKLRLLHTAKFAADAAQREKVETLFKEDMKERISDDDSNMEMENRNGHLYYAIVQLKDKFVGRGEGYRVYLGRFICYQCKEKPVGYDITLAYMEGSATLSDLRESFKKK